MVLDTLANCSAYESIHPGFAAAFAFLRSPLAATLEPKAWGSENSLRHEIDSDRVFAIIQRYHTRLPSETFWEAHRKHIDVQFVAEGVERMGWLPLAQASVLTPYDAAKEYAKLKPRREQDPTYVRVEAGLFTIFMPEDAHMPSLIADGSASPVKKIVVKVRVR